MLDPLKPNDIILRIREELEPWIQHHQGRTSVANNAFEVIEQLGANPPGWQCIILWEGDEDVTGEACAGIVRNRIAIILSGNRGLRLWRGENLHEAYGDQPALLTILADLRARLRALRFPAETTEQWMLYQGTEPEITPEGLPLDAYRMRFFLQAATTSLGVKL